METQLQRHAWLWFVLLCGGLVVLYYAIPTLGSWPWPVAQSQSAFWVVLPVLTVAAIVAGIFLQRPSAVASWWLFAVAVALTGLGDTLWEFPSWIGLGDSDPPNPSVIDYLYLASYLALFLAIMLLVRRRSPGRDRAAMLDALLIGAAASLASWVFLIQPVLESSAFSPAQVFVTAAYPIMDVLVLAGATRLWFAVDAGQNRSMRLIVVALLGVLVSDTVYSVESIQGTWVDGTIWDLGWFVFYIGLAAAALHPSVAALPVVVAPERAITRWRFILLLALMSMLPLLLLLGEADLQSTAQGLVILIGALVMFGLVLLRLNDLVLQLRETVRRERVLRDANEQLAAAADTPSIRASTVHAAAELVADGSAWIVGIRRTGSYAVVSAATTNHDGEMLMTDSTELLDHLCDDNLMGFGPSPLHTSLALPQHSGIIAKALCGEDGHREGYLLVAASPAPPRETGPALAALAKAAELAKARVGLARVLAERASDRRLGRMLQHSSDIIAVLDLDLTIRYLSPGAERLLGVAPHHVHGANWMDVVFPADAPTARELVERSLADRAAHGEMRLLAGDGTHRYVDVVALQVVEDDEPGYVLTCHDVTERRALEQQLTHQAFHDSLTGLANRSLFRDRLEHALSRSNRGNSQFAVLFIDLDDFKDVNDSLGHAAGDSLLRQVTLRLVDAVREQDTVARLGGDEFAILLESVEDESEVVAVAQRIVDTANQPFVLLDSQITSGVSVGVAITGSADDTADETMRNADLALYEAKNLGKNRFALFRRAMHEAAVDRLQLTADLRQAIESGELVAHYQPILDMTDGRLMGVEALARWHHPTRGLIGPDQFIPLAEETGLIVPLGEEMLRQALTTVANWQQIPGHSQIGVSVNLSVRQLLHDDIVEQVTSALHRSGINPNTVILEITESVLLPDGGVTLERLNELTALGVRLFIDDFGTGYSSLSYLQQLPVDGIKLAREFVSALGGGPLDSSALGESSVTSATGLVRTIRTLAVTLGLPSVVAEGVETPEQRDALLELGYVLGQGFLLARPMPAEAMRMRLTEAEEHTASLAAH